MKTLFTLLLVVLLPVVQPHGDDERLQNQMGTVQGTVRFLDHPDLGNTPATSAYFVIQRVDCPKVVVGVMSDVNGRYRISLATGRYRVFSRYGRREGETSDWFAPNQERFFELHVGDYKEFNISLRFRDSRK